MTYKPNQWNAYYIAPAVLKSFPPHQIFYCSICKCLWKWNTLVGIERTYTFVHPRGHLKMFCGGDQSNCPPDLVMLYLERELNDALGYIGDDK